MFKKTIALIVAGIIFALVSSLHAESKREHRFDVVIFGGTSAGVAAALQTARMGKTVVIIEPGKHIGGLTTSGLGWTDSGNKAIIGGISREFYQRIKRHYDHPDAWKHIKRENYDRYRPKDDAMWTFEPHVAERIMSEWLAEHKITVHFDQQFNRRDEDIRWAENTNGKKRSPRITAIRTNDRRWYYGKMFIDATYEGDLMAAAGVSYTVGREPNSKYNETINGVQKAKHIHHRFTAKVDPYIKPGDPASGLLQGIDAGPYPADGQGDHRVQAYCYRLCMSNVRENRVPFPKPHDYDERDHELLLRNFEAGDLRLPLKPDMMPNGKTDTNNNFAVSTDYIGQNYKYTEASHEERKQILAAHVRYQKGLMWTLANHPRVPAKIRAAMSRWGLAKDEFVDNDHWPHQIYVREARRMVSDYVITENDCRRIRDTPMSVGMGSYNMDSHNCMRYVTPAGFVQNEGDIQVNPGGPYKISYLSIVPKKGQAANLLVPVCLACSHIAYGSVRMEPVFMILGQSAATAACQAIDDKVDVQRIDADRLRKRLLADGQVLEYQRASRPAHKLIDPAKLPGIVVDDRQAQRTGTWIQSTSVGGYVGQTYLHDNNESKGMRSVRFEMPVNKAGRYEVRVSYTPNPNRASRVPVTITSADGVMTAHVNQKKKPLIAGAWVSLGVFRFDQGKTPITISNKDTDGYVTVDAVWLLPMKKP